MRTYKELIADYQQIEKEIKTVELITKAGIAQGKAHFLPSLFDAVTVKTAYSMGEYVAIYIKGIKVYEHDQTANYSSRCKWQARHGKVNIYLTLKAANQLIDMLAQRASDLNHLVIRENYYHWSTEKTEPLRMEIHKKRIEIVGLIKSSKIDGEFKKLTIY